MENVGADVTKLMAKHAEAVATIRERCDDAIKELPPAEAALLSDLCITRHLLSQEGSLEKAEATVRKALAFAADPKNARLLANVRDGTPPSSDGKIQPLIRAGLWTEGPLINGAPVWIIRAGYADAVKMMDEVSAEEVLEWLLYHRLHAMRIIDRLSLESGKFVKTMVINDLRSAGLFQSKEKRFFKVLGKLSQMLEFLCPQNQMKMVILNPQPFMSAIFAIVKNVLPKKALAKVAVCRGETLVDRFADCPFAKLWWSEENVPDFLGGSARVPEGHSLYVGSTAPMEGAELHLGPKAKCDLEVSVPEGQGRVELQILCLPHGMAMNPGVEVSVSFASAKTLASDDADSASCQGEELMPGWTCKAEQGSQKYAWTVQGPGVVVVNLRNPAFGKHKSVRYTLQLAKTAGDAKAAAAKAAAEMNAALEVESEANAAGS